MTLQEYLSYITTTKYALNDIFDSILDVSSYAFNQYPDLCYNCLTKRYNDGYRDGYTYASGTTYSGDKRALKTVTAASTSWQGNDYSDYSTLVNIMSAVADIREQMRTVLGTSSNQFVTYPSVLTNGMAAQYNAGYAQGQTDGTQTEPPVKVATPVIELVTDNLLNISSSNATSLRIWVSNTSGGQPISGSTTLNVSGNSTQYSITGNVNNKYICAMGMASGLTNSDIESQQLTYVAPEEPVVVIPDAPTVRRESPTDNRIHFVCASGCQIKYTLNAGATWTTTSSNDLYVSITSDKGANTIGALAIDTSTLAESSTSWYSSAFNVYVAPSQNLEEPTDTPMDNPFWMYLNNQTGSYTIRTDDRNKIQISTTRDFNNLLTPTIDSSGNDVFTITGKKYYFFRAYSESTAVAPLLYLVTYTGGMMFNIGGNLRSLAPNGSRTLNSSAVAASAFVNYFSTDSLLKQAVEDTSLLYFPDSNTKSYYKMFYGCTSLKKIPSTITSTIASQSFYSCFQGCTKLEKGCSLTATTAAANGCNRMFYNCTSMTEAGNIAATSCGNYSFYYMFYNCTNLEKGPEQLICSTIGNSSFAYMFANCSKLKSSPILRTASSGGTSIFNCFLKNCSSLEYIEIHWVTWNSSVTENWVDGVPSSGTVLKGSECEWYMIPDGQTVTNYGVHYGVNGVPEGWIIEEES